MSARSAGESGAVDFDLLADYVGGALDGTPEEVAVARLIAEDAQWAQAYARLARDAADVRVALARWGAQPAPMPPDVAERLSAALRDADAGRSGAEGRHGAPADQAARVGALRRPARPDGGSARPAGRRTGRRLPRWATPTAVAAALAAVVGLGVSQLAGDVRSADNGAALSRDAAQPQRAEGGSAEQAAADPSPGRVVSTEIDYTRQSLANMVVPFASAGPAKAPAGQSAARLPNALSGPPIAGDRAATPSTLTACLRAIADEHARGAPRFDLVEYARFEGRPALIVVFADADGQRWAWAVGPECGQPQAGAAVRYTARVG